MPSPIMQAIKQICDEKNIAVEAVIETIEAALAAAYRKDFGTKDQNVKVVFDPESGNFEAFDVKTVVEDQELPPEPEMSEDEKSGGRGYEPPAPPAEPVIGPDGLPIPPEKKFNPKTEVMVTAAREGLKNDAEIGETIKTKLEVPAAFGRMAAQTAKQVITQKLREAERNKIFGEFKDREHELVNATVQRREGRLVLIDLGRVTAVMPPDEQIAGERYESGNRLKVYITAVRMTTKGPEVVVSRAHPDIVRKLFTMEIPEVAGGIVKIEGVAREAGSRAKVAVSSTQANVDPVGSCIGQRGTRIQTVIAELGGEKVDIIPYDADPAKFIANALAPAKVVDVRLRDNERAADVIVSNDQLSLAIGRGGQNVRLAARLTGWKLSINEAGGGDQPIEGATAEPTPAAPAETPAE
ncbi:transcription termination/antitermination protein NusA [Candidatus Uhrbacteria bacterium]|nr:transcription termination/antitermination protein NusA [Candidatus Uhrbacteria bacterium]